MSSLIKSAVNYKCSAFVNFKVGKEGFEYASIQPQVQYKDKDSSEFKTSKYWSLEEAQAMIGVLQRAIAHAEERLQPIKKMGGKYDEQKAEHESHRGELDQTWKDEDLPF